MTDPHSFDAKPDGDTRVDSEHQPIIEHLREFKKRLLIAVGAYAFAVIISYFFAEKFYAFLVQPLADAMADEDSRRLIYTGLLETFFTYLKLSMTLGLMLSFPIVASQIYLFLAPGLYKKEKAVFLPYLFAAPACFLIGAAFCYYFIFPNAWQFFLSFETLGGEGQLPIQLEAKVSEYLSLVTQLIIAFGLAFQLPVVLVLLSQFGVIKAATIAGGRKYALVIIVACSAIITPPDIFSQIALSIPVYALYELSIILCRMMEKRRGNNIDENE